MKLRADADKLADAVSYTAKALPGRAAFPVLLGMMLTTTNTGLHLAASDTEVYATAAVTAEIADDGRALVSGRLLADICARLPKTAQVDIELDDSSGRLILACGTARFNLPTLPVDEYPSLPALPDAVATTDAEDFAAAVAQVAVAVGTDDALPAMTGIEMSLDGTDLILAATDRYRIGRRALTVRPTGTLPTVPAKKRRRTADDETGTAAPTEGARILIPGKTLADAARALSGDHTLTLHWSEGLFALSLPGGRSYMTRLLTGYTFPSFDKMFAVDRLLAVTVQASDAAAAIQRVALVAARNTAIRLHITDGELAVDAGSGDDAHASDRIPANVTGDLGLPLTIAFNPAYLLDALKAPGTPEARIEIAHPHQPVRLLGRTDEIDEAYQHLLMPIRLTETS